MHNQPVNPLDEQQAEIERLRKENNDFHKYLRTLFSEVYVVRSVVEAIRSHENESDVNNDKRDVAGSCFETGVANILENALEACNITLREDESDSEIIHVYQMDQRLQTFSTAEWQWMYDDGTWPWEHEDSNQPVV